MTKEDKQQAVDALVEKYNAMRDKVKDIDPRLQEYIDGLVMMTACHNTFEILGALRFLRMLDTYDFDAKKVQQVIRLREGEWKRNGNTLEHVRGGLAQPGTSGAQYYRWEPFQVFVLASVFGFKTWFDTQNEVGSRAMLPTEREQDGHIWDHRRVCTDFTFYGPRKTDKTGLSAFIQVVFFLLEDSNSESYCCANASGQSALLFRRTKLMLGQLDDGHRIRMTETVCDWRPQFKVVRDSSIRPLSAGGKTKDGMFAQLCCADEYGSAPYTNGKSDMKMLVDVVQSSMGPRREPLTFTTTTAGRIQSGPFIEKLDMLHRLLERELKIARGEERAELSQDRIMCLCLEPDEWEASDEETLLTSYDVRKKVNPMLGKIVQHQFYDDAVAKAKLDGDMGEVVSKLFNVYQSGTMKEWITPEEVRSIQVERRVDDCVGDDWLVFVGMDFSKGDDLNGAAFLCHNTRTGEFFGDMDVYVSEEAVNQSPIRTLWEDWAAKGWVSIVPGKTFDPSWPVRRIMELYNKGVNFMMFGYDPYNAKVVVNAMSQWVFDMGVDPKQVVVPVRQNFASYSPAVKEFDYMVKRTKDDGAGHRIPDPLVHLSKNPLWPYCFGCVMLQESNDGMGNLKPVKRDNGAATKVDPVQMLLSALILYDAAESQIN